MVELPNFCFEIRPTIIRSIYEAETWRNLQIMVIIIIHVRSGSIPRVLKVIQVLLRPEQRIRERTGEVSRENQSSPSWDLNEICT